MIIKPIKGMAGKDFLENISFYYKEICSHNGVPKIDRQANKVTCECEPHYTNEPREKYKKYINGHFVQCSYERKRRFFAFFLAGVSPFGFDYLYLGHFHIFLVIFFLCVLIISFNIISFVLNYKINKRNEEAKRQINSKNVKKVFNIRNININEENID